VIKKQSPVIELENYCKLHSLQTIAKTSCGGCVRYGNLILRLKTRTDDSRAILYINPIQLRLVKELQINLVLVRFCGDYRFKPHIPPFEQIPANSVKFQPCDYTAQAEYLSVSVNRISI